MSGGVGGEDSSVTLDAFVLLTATPWPLDCVDDSRLLHRDGMRYVLTSKGADMANKPLLLDSETTSWCSVRRALGEYRLRVVKLVTENEPVDSSHRAALVRRQRVRGLVVSGGTAGCWLADCE